MNTFGHILRLTTFGESHGPSIGGVIDGCPAGVKMDIDEIQQFVYKRSSGGGIGVTARSETDRVEILSGIFEGRSLGTPIGFIIRNSDVRSSDYTHLNNAYRPNHADYTYDAKYGLRDYRGGGRASARETVCRMVGGAVAKSILRDTGISINSEITEIGGESDQLVWSEMLERSIKSGDTLGGVVSVKIENVPAGLGNPVFAKLQSELASAMFSIPAVKGFEYGDGFDAARDCGSNQADQFIMQSGRIATVTNHSGGIQGGISNGMPICFRIAFKPIATLGRSMATIDSEGNEIILPARGRHDVCAALRGKAVAEGMAWMIMADAWLASRLDRL